MDIQPGSTLTVEVSRRVTSDKARKTLTRVFGKDPAIRKAQRWRKAHRPSWQEKRRGGRWWHHQMRSFLPVSLDPGSKYTVQATVDVIRDLNSVEPFVSVSAK